MTNDKKVITKRNFQDWEYNPYSNNSKTPIFRFLALIISLGCLVGVVLGVWNYITPLTGFALKEDMVLIVSCSFMFVSMLLFMYGSGKEIKNNNELAQKKLEERYVSVKRNKFKKKIR